MSELKNLRIEVEVFGISNITTDVGTNNEKAIGE